MYEDAELVAEYKKMVNTVLASVYPVKAAVPALPKLIDGMVQLETKLAAARPPLEELYDMDVRNRKPALSVVSQTQSR
jgi:hypothetical protein